MFPSEKSNTSGLVPPAFTCGNSFSGLSAIHLQIHVTNLFVVWHRLPVKNIGHPFLWVLTPFGAVSRRGKLFQQRPTPAIRMVPLDLNWIGLCRSVPLDCHLDCSLDFQFFWIDPYCSTGFSVVLGFWPPPLACFSCARHRRRAGPWSPRWRIKPPGPAWSKIPRTCNQRWETYFVSRVASPQRDMLTSPESLPSDNLTPVGHRQYGKRVSVELVCMCSIICTVSEKFVPTLGFEQPPWSHHNPILIVTEEDIKSWLWGFPDILLSSSATSEESLQKMWSVYNCHNLVFDPPALVSGKYDTCFP